jgi:hypothetical protein
MKESPVGIQVRRLESEHERVNAKVDDVKVQESESKTIATW